MPRKRDAALRAAREHQILCAAKKCFVANGFHGTSMRQILAAAGISSGGAYNYFSSKDDIVKGLVEAERKDIDLLLEGLSQCRDPLLGIAQLVFDSIAHTSRDDAVLAAEIYAESCRNPAIGNVMQTNTERIRHALHTPIAHGTRLGVIRSCFSTRELTEWLLALVDGSIGRIAANPGLKPKKAAQIARDSVLALLKP